MTELRNIRLIEHKKISGATYDYYAVPIPASLGNLWSGARVSIENRGNTLIIQKINEIK